MVGRKKPRNQRRKERKKLFKLEMNSLLDILVILLVFLIRSYGSSETNIIIPKEIVVPFSKSLDMSHQAVIVQVSNDYQIWVDEKMVADLKADGKKAYDKTGRKIWALYDKLVENKVAVDDLAKQSEGAKKFTGLVNLIMDKQLPYRVIKEIMYTASEAGYKEFKFVVISEDE